MLLQWRQMTGMRSVGSSKVDLRHVSGAAGAPYVLVSFRTTAIYLFKIFCVLFFKQNFHLNGLLVVLFFEK